MLDQSVKQPDRRPLHRVPDWPRWLSSYVNERRSVPYAHGKNDCVGLVLDWVQVVAGVDLLPGIIRPTTAFGAHRFLVDNGYGDIEGLMTALLGSPLSTPKLAQRGDIVSFDARGTRHLALVVGSSAVTPGRDELLWVPRPLWCAGWKIG